jgi:ribulose 1,5-bisphosphate synthetase/thiazole synthase
MARTLTIKCPKGTNMCGLAEELAESLFGATLDVLYARKDYWEANVLTRSKYDKIVVKMPARVILTHFEVKVDEEQTKQVAHSDVVQTFIRHWRKVCPEVPIEVRTDYAC